MLLLSPPAPARDVLATPKSSVRLPLEMLRCDPMEFPQKGLIVRSFVHVNLHAQKHARNYMHNSPLPRPHIIYSEVALAVDGSELLARERA